MPNSSKTYLSLDVDFWNNRDYEELREVMERVKRLQRRGKDLLIVDRHHKLVPHANKYRCTEVINVDAHSDIVNSDSQFRCDGTKLKLNCGTWANYLKVRQKFRWMFPKGHKMKDGLCHWPQTNEFSPFTDPSIAGWKEVTKEPVDEFPMDLMLRKAAIGIAISFEYLMYGEGSWEMLKVMTDVFGEKAMPKTFNDFGTRYGRNRVMRTIGR
jgi:hypothetical protein